MKGVKRLLPGLAVMLMLAGGAGAVQAEQIKAGIQVHYATIKFVFDGKAMKPPAEQEAFIYNGSTYVPLRFVAYSFGKAVSWNASTYTVTLKEPGKEEKAEILSYREERILGAKIAPVPEDVTITSVDIGVYFEKVNYVFDGQEKAPPEDLPGLIYEDSLYVPLRFLSESIGKKVDWNPDTYTISAAGGISFETEEEVDLESEGPDGSQTGGGGGGAGGGGAGEVQSEEALVLVAGALLYQLQDQVEQQFSALKDRYLAASEQDKPAIRAEGEALLRQTDTKVESILSNLKSQLIANGHNTSAVDEIRAMYNQKKAEERSKLGI